MTWRDVRDVETAGGDVGGDQDVGLAGAEAAHDAVALGLGEVAVERLDRVAARHQRLAQLVDAGLVRQKIIADCGVSASRMRVSASILRARGTSYEDCRICGTVICLPATVIRCGSCR